MPGRHGSGKNPLFACFMHGVVEFAKQVERAFQAHRNQFGLAARFGGPAAAVGGTDRGNRPGMAAGARRSGIRRRSPAFGLARVGFHCRRLRLRCGFPLPHQGLGSIARYGLVAHVPARGAFVHMLRIPRRGDEENTKHDNGTHALLHQPVSPVRRRFLNIAWRRAVLNGTCRLPMWDVYPQMGR